MPSMLSDSKFVGVKCVCGHFMHFVSVGMLLVFVFVNVWSSCEASASATTSEGFLTSPSANSAANQLRNEISWTISKRSCSDQQLGCSCNRSLSERAHRARIFITCRCDDPQQVVNVKGSEDKDGALTEDTVWTFERCSRVVIHSNALSAVTGAPFTLHLDNISSLIIQESAFALPSVSGSFSGGSSSSSGATILFNNVGIGEIPSKAFPSFLTKLGFLNSNIGTLSSASIRPLQIMQVLIENSTVGVIQTNAFFDSTLISNSLTIRGSHIKTLEKNSIASGIDKMIWLDSTIENLESNSMSTSIASAIFQGCDFGVVNSHGIAFKEWTRVSFVNNTFDSVNKSGIDLSQFAPTSSLENANSAEISGNTWTDVETDFIVTGSQTEVPLAFVRNNTFSKICDCGTPFGALLSLTSSQSWFHDQLFNNSRCPITEKGMSCLGTNESFLFYSNFPLLCSNSVFMCLNELEEVTSEREADVFYTPQLPNRLRILAIFIGALAVSIVVSLLVTMCVFVLRRKKPHKNSGTCSTKSICKEMSGGSHSGHNGHDFADIVYKMSQLPSGASGGLGVGAGFMHRPRSTIFEDVEMEDKGVQTMPNELSTDVLEGLREKLSRPDSFWDAKETIDHLYDLIHVKEQCSAASPLSSPPDVTMCINSVSGVSGVGDGSGCGGSCTGRGAAVTVNGKTPPSLPACSNSHSNPSSANSTHNNHSNNMLTRAASSCCGGHPPPTRYAQIRSKPKTAPLCDYRDPSDSQMHIYSELTPHGVIHATNTLPPLNPVVSKINLSPHSPLSHPPSKSSSSSSLVSCQGHHPHPHHHPHNSQLPLLCEYTEPKDVQTHVYAELSNPIHTNTNKAHHHPHPHHLPHFSSSGPPTPPLPPVVPPNKINTTTTSCGGVVVLTVNSGTDNIANEPRSEPEGSVDDDDDDDQDDADVIINNLTSSTNVKASPIKKFFFNTNPSSNHKSPDTSSSSTLSSSETTTTNTTPSTPPPTHQQQQRPLPSIPMSSSNVQ